MLNIKAPYYRFCPFCGKTLESKTEEGKNRKFCSVDNWTYYPNAFQASVAIIVKDKKILLVQRNREPYKGKWMMPAGFVDFGEHPKETVMREIMEETGLSAKNPVFYDVLQSTDDARALGTLVFYYTVEVTGKITNSDTEENSDIKWFDLSNPPAIAWKDHSAVIKKLHSN